MALYALQTAYAPVGWAALLKDPQNRMEAVSKILRTAWRPSNPLFNGSAAVSSTAG